MHRSRRLSRLRVVAPEFDHEDHAPGRHAGPGRQSGARRDRARKQQAARTPAGRAASHFASAATCTRTILSGEAGGSPLASLSTTSMPDSTSPITVYWPFRNEASPKQMNHWLLALSLLLPLRAIPTVPRLKDTLE